MDRALGWFLVDPHRLGVKRQSIHSDGTPRLYENPNIEDVIGVCGEAQFAKEFGFLVDANMRKQGDGGIDFITDCGTIDVKTARKPYNLLVKESEIDRVADYLVLAQYEDGKVELLGWEYGDFMANCPKRTFLLVPSYFKPREMLRPMWELKEILRDAVQIFVEEDS